MQFYIFEGVNMLYVIDLWVQLYDSLICQQQTTTIAMNINILRGAPLESLLIIVLLVTVR